MSMWIFSRKTLQTAPLSSLLAGTNPWLCCHSFVKMPREKGAGPPFMRVLNCCHKQRPGLIGLGILEVKAAPAHITVACAGKGQQERCGSSRHLVGGSGDLLSFRQTFAVSSTRVPGSKVKPPLLSFLPFEHGFWANMLPGVGHLPWKEWRNNPCSASSCIAGKQTS